MRILLTLIAITFSLCLMAQTADVSKGCAPLQVQFSPPAGASGFFWDFKDGGSSNLSAPTNIFTTPGTYEVVFKNTPNGPTVGTTTITVFPKPVIGITADPSSGCRPLAVSFKDTTQINPNIQILSRNWVLGDGNSIQNIANPSYTYFTTGIFTISVEYTTNYPSCNVTAVFPDFVKAGSKPVAGFTPNPNPPIACVPPLNVTFTNTTVGGSGNLSYAWDFGNGVTSALTNPPAQNYTTAGSFKVRLTATDAFGCVDSLTKTVKIGSPEASFVISDTICFGDTIKLQNQSDAGVYNWNFGPNGLPQTSTVFEPMVVFNQSGTQIISLKVTAAGNCSNTITKAVYVEKPNADFTVTPLNSCNNPTIFQFNAAAAAPNQWNWAFSDETTSNIKNPSYTWHLPDTTGYTPYGLVFDTVTLVVTTAAGCVAKKTIIDSIWLANARFMPNVQHGCAPLSVTFADSSISREPIVEWTWLFDDGTPPVVANTGADIKHDFTNPGEYHVKLRIRNANGCIDTSYAILIEVGSPISGNFSVDKQSVCPGDTVHFKNLTNDPRIDGWHFSSDNDRLFHCYQDPNPYWVYTTETGPFDVKLTIDYNGCLETVTKSDWVLVKGPIAHLHYKTTCDNALLFDFTDESQDATMVKWYLGDGDSSILNTFSHLYMRGTYTVILKAENPASGCPISYDTATVYATQLKAAFNFPDTICGDTNYDLDGGKSTDVNATCYKGYTWYFSFQRPIRTSDAVTSFGFGPSGPQTIWLEVEDINGCKDTTRNDFVVYNRKPAFVLDDREICIPGNVQFTDKSTGDASIISWDWDFGDGGTSSAQNPSHVYTTPPPNGQYFTVKLNIRDDKGCYGAITDSVVVYKPVSSISPQQAQICVGKTVNFSATDFTQQGSNLSWSWNFGNGGTATGKNVSQTFTTPGTFITVLKFTEIASGCQGESTVPIQVQAYPIANFTSNVDGQNIICYPQNMQFINTSVSANPLATIWTMSNGVTATGTTAATVFPKGTYSVKMITATSYGCADTTERSFTVVGPEGDFTIDKAFICKGDKITFNLKDTVDISGFAWSFGDGTTLDNTNPTTHTYNFQPPSGQTLAKLVLTGEDAACTTIVEKLINFSLVNADFVAKDSSLCLGLAHLFLNNSSSADQSQWTFGDGGGSGNNSPSHTYAGVGNFLVTLIVTDLPLGCKDTITRFVAVESLPDIFAYGDTICKGDTATIGLLSPEPGNSYAWAPANLVLPPANAPVVKVLPGVSTKFVVTVTDPQGCKGVDTAFVYVPLPYAAGQNLDTLVSQGSPVTLPVQYDPNYQFSWNPDPGTARPPVVMSKDTSLFYTLKVTDLLGCDTSEITFHIRVIPEKVWAPNAFTPNGDNLNNVFKLLAAGEQELVAVNNFQIFNRWGQLVYEASGNVKSVAWDGKQKGEDAPSDVYVWKASVRFLTGKEQNLQGQITLLR